MSKATFYEHFGNKEECLARAVRRRHRRGGRGHRAGRAGPRRGEPAGPGRRLRARVPRRRRRLPRPGADAAGRDHRRGPARGRAPRRRADAGRRLHVRGQPRRRRGRPGPPPRLAARRLRDRRRDRGARLAPAAHQGSRAHPRSRAGARAARSSASWARSRRARARFERRARRARGRDHRVPRVPAAGRVARARGAGEARVVPRLGLLGPPDPGLRRPGRAGADPRPGARRARGEPHRPRLHRRPLGRLPVRRAAPQRLREPADLRAPRRRARAARLLDHRRGALRAARQQAAAGGARALLGVAGARARADRLAARGRLPRRVRVGGGAAHARAARRAGPAAAPEVRARRRAWAAARLLPPQPAEHVHRGADPGDDGCDACNRARELAA